MITKCCILWLCLRVKHLVILVARANVGVIDRGPRVVALGSIPWAVGIMFGKALRYTRTLVGRSCVGVSGRGRSRRHWVRTEVLR
jgi:hypothetical protein